MQCRGFRSDANIQLRKNCLTGVNSTLLLPLSPPPPPSPRPTLEVTIVETASTLRRKKRADLGIALIDICVDADSRTYACFHSTGLHWRNGQTRKIVSPRTSSTRKMNRKI